MMFDRDVGPEFKPLVKESGGRRFLVEMYDDLLKMVGKVETPKGDVEKERATKTGKGSYESVTTNKYFEGYDDLELGGNTGIKDKIKINIVEAEALNTHKYEECARYMNISVEEFKQRLQAKVEDMVGKSDFFVAVRLSVFERIMSGDGRWRSQFETNSSNGCLDPSYRATAELKMFGFNEGADSPKSVESGLDDSHSRRRASREMIEHNREWRPIYGYFSNDAHGAINGLGRNPPENAVRYYGNINVRLKREKVLGRTTITFHDSLGKESNYPPSPAAKPHFTSISLRFSLGREILENSKGSSMVNWGENYTEAQYHGQLTLDDVECICVSRDNGVYQDDIDEIKQILIKYKLEHPDSTIQLIEY